MSRLSSRPLATVLAAALAAGGCSGLAPRYEQPPAPIAGEWPIAATTATTEGAAEVAPGQPVPVHATADVGWRDFFTDERLEQLVALALENNRDLRAAVLNVERARAFWAIRRADRLPSVDGAAVGVRQRLPSSQTGTGDAETISGYTLQVGVTSYELDLFGRVNNLSQAALERYFATEEARRATQIALAAEVASAYVRLASDLELVKVAIETLDSQEASYRLTQQRYERGAVSGLEVSQAQTTVESARVDLARFRGDAAQSRHLLTFLVGTAIDPSLLPSGFDFAVTGLRPVPAGLPSAALLRRPDVQAAEHQLIAAHADIGAARAAFLPRISLTGTAGASSDELSSLFDGGSGIWSFIPRIDVPIFQGGRLRANLRVAETDRAIAVADYERAIQAGFREVSDALALSTTLHDQIVAHDALVAAARRAYELSEARYDAGRDSYFVLLDSQRIYYRAQQGRIVTRYQEQANRIELYRALGGGWLETTGTASQQVAE
jgi:multidrug efflux system outer membrane protein